MIGASAASSIGARNGFSTETRSLRRRRLQVFLTSSRRQLDRCEPFAEAGFDEVGIGGDQRVLGGKVLVDPVGGLVRRLELAEVGDQPVAQRRRLVCVQNDPRRTDDLLLSVGDVAGGLSSAARAGRSAAATPIYERPRPCRRHRLAAFARSGASRSSSPAMPTSVNSA